MEIEEVRKSPEVDLDTDGVKEQSVEVEEKKVESTEPELPREEVDLGYTEPKKEGIEGITVEQKEEINMLLVNLREAISLQKYAAIKEYLEQVKNFLSTEKV